MQIRMKEALTLDEALMLLEVTEAEVETLRQQLAEARKQEEAIGAGGVSGKRITDDGALEALQACEQAYHRMIVDGAPQDCRAHDAARVAFWRVFGDSND